MTSYLRRRLQIGETTHSPSLDGLVRFLQESVGPGVVRVLVSEAGEPLSCACSPNPFDGLHSDAIHPAAVEINPVRSCTLLSRGVWTVLCQRGTAPQAHGEILCAAATIEGLGSLAVQAEVTHFARQDFRYRRFCRSALHLGLLSVISLLESQRALEKTQEREEQVRHLVHSNALARQEERGRLSLQLHDGAIQSMAAAFHMIETVREMSEHQPEQSATLQQAEEVMSQAIREIRGVISALGTATPVSEAHNQQR